VVMACVGLYLLAFDLHFALPVCAALSLAYWCSALWVGWSLSLIVGGGLVAVAVAMRRSWLLFPFGPGALLTCTLIPRSRAGEWAFVPCITSFRALPSRYEWVGRFKVDPCDSHYRGHAVASRRTRPLDCGSC